MSYYQCLLCTRAKLTEMQIKQHLNSAMPHGVEWEELEAEPERFYRFVAAPAKRGDGNGDGGGDGGGGGKKRKRDDDADDDNDKGRKLWVALGRSMGWCSWIPIWVYIYSYFQIPHNWFHPQTTYFGLVWARDPVFGPWKCLFVIIGL